MRPYEAPGELLVPLHVKSHYSLGHGTASIRELVERAARLGLPALGLTDVENIYGQVVFHHFAREVGLRPITGAELRIAPGEDEQSEEKRSEDDQRSERMGKAARAFRWFPAGERVVLLAESLPGYQSLCRVLTRRRLEEDLSLRALEKGALEEGLEGLFVLTDRASTLRRLLALYGLDRRRLRLLLVRPARSLLAERELLLASRELGVPVVADPDIDFLDPEDRRFHLLKLAIAGNTLLSLLEEGLLEEEAHVRDREGRPGNPFPGTEEARALFADHPEAVVEARRLAERCDLDLREAKPIFPRMRLEPGETSQSRLSGIAWRVLRDRGLDDRDAYRRRLQEELRIIGELGFPDYFLLVGDIVRFARARGIETVGRGSGGGSLVAHLLGITNVDPIEHRLYFERFLHAGRSDLPDIDIDLCWIRRDEVIDYVYRAYGQDRVAMISSHITFQPRSAFRETIKAFGVPMETVNRYSRRFPTVYPEVSFPNALRKLLLSSPLSREIPIDEEPFRTALPLAERLLNHPHHLSVHPGGIVVSDRPLDRLVALERAAKGIVVTQYDMYSIEKVGLVKIDLLGNRCLTELQETLDLAREGAFPGQEPPREGQIRLSTIPDRDPETIRTLKEARTLGCFQLESPAMRSLLSKLEVEDLRGCIRAVAIIRPGAAAGQAKETYIQRANGEEPPRYLHPSLEEVLQETYGVVLYEEDVMCMASAVLGISLAEGEVLRNRIKKCRTPGELEELRSGFLERTAARGIPSSLALDIWRDLCRFAYTFSKAHASGYGLLAYQSVYLKTHFPVEFGCAVLNNHAGMYPTRTLAEEVKRMGVVILPPSVNRSGVRFTVERRVEGERRAGGERRGEGKAVRTALSRVKGLATRSMQAILEARECGGPFRSLADFLHRVAMPRREVEWLILSGGFDDLPPPRGKTLPLNQPQLLWELASTPESPRRRAGAASERGRDLLELGQGREDHPPLRPYDPLVRIQNELRHLEMGITDHPLRLLREKVRRRGCLTTREACAREGQEVRVAGLIAARREIRNHRGEPMQFITLEDEVGLLEATLFPRAHQRYSSRLFGLGPYLVEGKIERDRRAINLEVSRLELLGELELEDS